MIGEAWGQVVDWLELLLFDAIEVRNEVVEVLRVGLMVESAELENRRSRTYIR